MKMTRRRMVGSVSLAALVVGIVCWRHGAAARGLGRSALGSAGADKAIPAALYEVRQDRLTDVVDGLIGTIKGNTIELTFNGQEERLIAARAQVGERVRKGDVLFELDHERSAARKSQAQANYERVKELQDAGGATARDVTEAEAAYQLASKDYEDTFIYAPQNGIVSQINRQPGETVGRNEVIAVLISSNDRFTMETGVIEGQLDQVAAGQKAIVEIEAFGNQPVEGRVQGVSHEVTTSGRTGTVIVALPREIQSKLRPGMSARCRIYVYDAEAYAVPRAAYDADKHGVFVVGGDQHAHFVKTALGHMTRDYYEVTDGLKEGDRIVSDLAANPMEENAAVTADGELQHYKNPNAGPATL